MADMVTIRGVVWGRPRDTTTGDGLRVVNLRLGSSQRRFNTSTKAWEYAPSNWYNVAAFRALAGNVAASVHEGDHVVVTGRLRISTWTKGEKSGLDIKIEAETIGHDLTWGTAMFTRTLFSAASRSVAQREPVPIGPVPNVAPVLALASAPSGRDEPSGGGVDADEDTTGERDEGGWPLTAAQ